MKKVGDIEFEQHDVCPVTGLPVLRKPEWTDVGFGKDYRVTVTIVGDNILRVQPSGYVTLNNQINVLKLTEQAPAEAISGGRPYIHIEDWSNFRGASLAARKYYMDEMQARKRISGVIFCHVSYMFKMSVKLGKSLRMVKFPVHIVDDYSEALRLALDIQSKENAQEDKPVIAPSIKKDAPINVFPSDEKSVCPVTSLPVTTRPEWTDIPINDNYSVSFSLIGNAILRVSPNGIITDSGTRRLIEEREKVLRDMGLEGKRYAEIRDHSMIASKPSKKSRMMLTDLLLKETNEGSLAGFWVFNAPLVIRLMFDVGIRMYKPPAPVGAVKDYREAAENAVNVLDQNGIDVGIRQWNRLTKDEWNLEFENFAVRFELIEDDIIYSVSHGSLKEAYVDKFFELHEKILEETGLTAKGCFYRILDWENLQKTTWKARKMYIDGIKDLNRKVPCKYSVIFGLNKFMKTIISISKQLIPFSVTTARNFEEAMAIIERKKKRGTETRIAKIKGRTEETPQDEKTRNYCDELLEFMGVINWDQEGAEWKTVGDSHPFKPVYDAMSIIKEDIDDLFRTQRQIKETLAREEEKYRDIFQNVSDFIYIHDLEGNFTENNIVWKKELGLTEDDLAGLNVKDLIPERYRHQFDGYLNRVKAKGKDEGLMGFMTKDGKERTLEYKNSLIHGLTGPIGVRGSARDITEQIRAQSALQQSEKKYRTILENIEDGYFEVDLAGNITFFNNALCRITGYPKDKLIGMNNREYMDEETAGKVFKVYSEIFRTGEPAKGFEYVILKNGNKKHVESSVSLIEDKEGQTIGFRGILRDISERKHAEEKIRQYSENLEEMVEQRTEELVKSEEKYRTILENIEDGYYEVDLAGNLTFFNDAVCRIMGYSEDDLMGMNNREYTDEENALKVYREYHKVYKTGIPTKRIDWEVIKKDRTIRSLENSISLITGLEGKPIGFRGIIRDVTERKVLESEILKKRKQAEEASRAKSEFLANMSHEIRTPLNGIVGMAELALDTELDDNQKNIFYTINTEANALQDVISEILDFSKIEAGKFDLEEIPFDLRSTIEDVANSFAYRAEQKGLDFISFLAPDVPSRLIGDPARLRQIMVNLAGNSLKFTHEGELYVKGELVEEIEDRIKIRFSVKDTGIGIPEDRQATIFESFTQADGSTTRKYGGTGLGTTISKQLVELMGGEIGLESEEGKGSTFWFTAFFGKQEEKQQIPAAKDLDLNNLKVLIVDDNQTNRFILMEYLKSWGCLPVEAVDGKEALIVFRAAVSSESPFDLILTDFQMPEINGFDFAKEIKTIETLKEVPIIVLTSAGRKGDGRDCKEIGINGYLTKPIRQGELHKAIVSVLRLSTGQEMGSRPELVTRHSVAEDYRKEIQILLVEDYPTNQQVAMRHLIKNGYQVDLAEDGSQAVKAYKLKRYDLIFMDIQMPIMDGYAATREIRKIEARNLEQSTIQSTPIVAMTAHAFKGYREKCIEAGMNDYIAKPLRRKELLIIVEKWSTAIADCGLRIADSKSGIQNPKSELGNDPIDFARAIEEFEGDEEFLMEVLEGFIGNVTSQIKLIRQAISDGDGETVRREAHSIKGGAANLTANELSGIAFEIENIGSSGALEKGIETLERLEQEFHRLKTFATLG